MTVKRPGRRPDLALDIAVRDAVIELLFERGFEMTFDEVAARAGVGRATVFRRFSTKRELILRAIEALTFGQVDIPDTGALRDDLIAGITDIVRVFSEPRQRLFARQLLGEACRDPAFTDTFREVMTARLELITTMLDRGVERGELPATTDHALIADLISGIIFIRLSTDGPLPDAEQIRHLVDGLLSGFASIRSAAEPEGAA